MYVLAVVATVPHSLRLWKWFITWRPAISASPGLSSADCIGLLYSYLLSVVVLWSLIDPAVLLFYLQSLVGRIGHFLCVVTSSSSDDPVSIMMRQTTNALSDIFFWFQSLMSACLAPSGWLLWLDPTMLRRAHLRISGLHEESEVSTECWMLSLKYAGSYDSFLQAASLLARNKCLTLRYGATGSIRGGGNPYQVIVQQSTWQSIHSQLFTCVQYSTTSSAL